MSSLRGLVGIGMGSIAVEAVHKNFIQPPPIDSLSRTSLCWNDMGGLRWNDIGGWLYSPTFTRIPSEYALNSGAYWHWIKA